MLNISYNLYVPYTLKESFFEIFEDNTPEKIEQLFGKWIYYAKTFSNWYNKIINSFYY